MAGHHDHDHHHAHGPADFGRAFAWGTAFNLAFVAVEGTAGFLTHSVALLADAGHNLSDVLGLLVAWAGAELAKRPASRRFTYGLRGSSILAALTNSLLLLVAVGAIALEAIQRFADPPPVAGATVMIVAAIGIVVNLSTALLFARGRKGDVNIRGAYLHMAADAAVSAGVVIGGGLILLTGAEWIDPAISLVIVTVILWSTWGLARESLTMVLQAVPAGIDAEAVERALTGLPGVARVHDLHIWPMSTTEAALTAHLVMPGGHPGDAFLMDLQHLLAHDFRIDHTTVQIELGEGAECRMHGRAHG
ncbi:cation diffusion facilitator family transporter [Sphingomonas psychrotolerans]|uniref:Cation diffusion facilitator family transporter n=1 Tax=Sphingomonas psychrotolerans TaxID=1327635 RepID=A0ABU3N3Z4_9SPHN|nr:cation diffusion facilitator family transporter [Sphingomonas psychrotolerans]MDT8759255.1 cation diffusion facilitator family transporter [Sphingomonas psychrotolerans]